MACETHEIKLKEVELLPCPTCGGKAAYRQTGTVNYFIFCGVICCTGCGLTTKEMPDALEKTKDKIVFEDWRERASYLWNQRKHVKDDFL